MKKNLTKASEIATIIGTIIAIIVFTISFTENSIKTSILNSFKYNQDSNISFEEQPNGVIDKSFINNKNSTISIGEKSK